MVSTGVSDTGVFDFTAAACAGGFSTGIAARAGGFTTGIGGLATGGGDASAVVSSGSSLCAMIFISFLPPF